jgi:hypothetical protein
MGNKGMGKHSRSKVSWRGAYFYEVDMALLSTPRTRQWAKGLHHRQLRIQGKHCVSSQFGELCLTQGSLLFQRNAQ